MLFTRRPSARFHRGRFSGKRGPAGVPTGPPQLWTIPTSVNCLRGFQIDFGATPASTLLASGTAPPVVTMSGTPAGVASIRLEIQTTGADGVATYRYGNNNDGSTASWIESGKVVPAGGGSYAAIGALAGVTFTFPAGSYSNTNVYQATCSSWVDQKNGTSYGQAVASKQPRILKGLSNHGSLYFDGVDDSMLEPTLDRPQPTISPTTIYFGIKQVSWTATRISMDSGSGVQGLTLSTSGVAVSPQLVMVHGVAGLYSAGDPVGSFARGIMNFTGTTNDSFKLGAAAIVTGTNTGNVDPGPGIRIGASVSDTQNANDEFLFAFYFDGAPNAGEIAAMDSAAAAWYSGLLI